MRNICNIKLIIKKLEWLYVNVRHIEFTTKIIKGDIESYHKFIKASARSSF